MSEEKEINFEKSESEEEEEIPRRRTKKTKKPAKKRIYNPWTKTYYSIRQRSSAKGKKGTIKGKWKPPKET